MCFWMGTYNIKSKFNWLLSSFVGGVGTRGCIAVGRGGSSGVGSSLGRKSQGQSIFLWSTLDAGYCSWLCGRIAFYPWLVIDQASVPRVNRPPASASAIFVCSLHTRCSFHLFSFILFMEDEGKIYGQSRWAFEEQEEEGESRIHGECSCCRHAPTSGQLLSSSTFVPLAASWAWLEAFYWNARSAHFLGGGMG